MKNGALDIEIMKYYEQFDCYLHTIPGIGMIATATILAEIGDIHRFKSSSALVAFHGSVNYIGLAKKKV